MFLMKIEKRRGRDLCILTFDSVVAPSKSKTKKSSGWIIIHLSLREWFNVLVSHKYSFIGKEPNGYDRNPTEVKHNSSPAVFGHSAVFTVYM